MAKTPKLNDLQLILLSTASQRGDGNLIPLPDAAAASPDRARTAIEALLKRGLAAEHEVRKSGSAWREEDDRPIGVAITDAGRAAIGVGDRMPAGEAEALQSQTPPAKPTSTADDATTPASPTGVRAGTKQALLVDLLKADGGASIAEITEATGWLPHTARAALTGLRKRGFMLASDKAEGVNRYRVEGAAA